MRYVCSGLMFLCFIFLARGSAFAIPLFANGQGGANCGLCHTAVPRLNAYGRYVLATNFSRGLNPNLQMAQNRALPVSLESTANTPPFVNGVTQFLAGGFAGREVTYFASVPIVIGGLPASGIDQVWVAYNGFARGNGSLQIGRFATPVFSPLISQPLTLTGYGPANLQVGLNASTLADNRWGASYTYLATPQLIANAAYVAGAGEGTAWTGSLQYLSTHSRWSGGIAGMSGRYPLPSGASDPYIRAAAQVSYGGERYEFTVLDIAGRDENPNDGASPPVGSNGFAVEGIYSPRPWANVDLRYEDNAGNPHYISDIAFNLRPDLVLTLEQVAMSGGKPAFSYQLLWAGPWYRNRFPPGAVPASASDDSALANGRSIYFTLRDSNGVRVTADPAREYQSCAVCHGPQGEGGVLLPDGAISAKLGPHAHMLDAMGRLSMGGTVMDWTVPQLERAISQGVDNMSMSLDPVMPRWNMTQRDLHDVAQYVLSLRGSKN